MALSNTQYNSLIRRYEAKQLENHHIVMERINSLYQKIPRLAEIALPLFKETLSTLIAEKKQLLISHGYPENYFEPPYDCPDCKDTGYIGGKKCHCFKQAAIDLVYTQSNIRQILQKENCFKFKLYMLN